MIAPLETLTVEIDSDVLAQAEKVCADIGITLQDALNMFLRDTGNSYSTALAHGHDGSGTSGNAGTETRLASDSPRLGLTFPQPRPTAHFVD